MNHTIALLTTCLLFAGACSNDHPSSSVEQTLCKCDVEVPPCCCTSPILIDVAGDGFRLTSWTDGVDFKPSPGFRPSARAWTEPASDDAWLVLDRDGDGAINDGTEMFGNATPQPQPPEGTLRNGFLALAQHDDDGNGVIDQGDAVFPELRLWQDADHDGVSQPWELHTLPDLGVAGISLAYAEAREADQHGNSFRYWAQVYGTAGSPVGMTAWDVWLVGVRPEPVAGFSAADTSASGGCGGGGRERMDPEPDRYKDRISCYDWCSWSYRQCRKWCQSKYPDPHWYKRNRCFKDRCDNHPDPDIGSKACEADCNIRFPERPLTVLETTP